jgi:hypothetical protein
MQHIFHVQSSELKINFCKIVRKYIFEELKTV